MAPAVLDSIKAFAARRTPDAGIEALGPVAARSVLLARDDQPITDPSRGVIHAGDINNTVMFVLFGLIGAAFVITIIWFFFWAKNGGFYFREDDWDDYKSTVLRRKGPNGTILSGATPSTQLGGGSIYKDIDDGSTEDATTVVSGTTGITGITAGASDISGREKRRKKREQKERDKERRREEKAREKEEKKHGKGSRKVGPDGALIDEDAEAEAKQHLRDYRHEKPARVGGINKESEGSAWDGSTNPTHSTASTSNVDSGSAVTSELMSNRERTPTSTPTKRDRESKSGGIRKVYSTADKTANRESERIRAEARRLQDKGRAAQRRDFSFQRADDTGLRRIEERSDAASSAPEQSVPGSWAESDAGTGSEVGTRSYHHSVHVPGTSSTDFAYAEERRNKRRGGGGYRREIDCIAHPAMAKSYNDGSSAIGGVVIGLLSSFGSALLIAVIFLIIYFFRYSTSGRILLDRLGRPGEYDDEQAFAREEAEALETMDDMARTEYLRAKAFIQANPPESVQTDISLSQYLAIQEKGVSAWEFEPELEIANCFVEGRTEIEFFDSECTVMSNLPVPKQNEVYYWEAKIYDKPESTLLSIGMATKPYPLFRLPGFHKYSVAYVSNGVRRFNQPFNPTPYGPQIVQGDVIGVGYRPRTGTIFFTRNGKKMEDVVHGLKSQNFFPAIGANGPSIVHVNFGQAGFVFIEANVKKWGLAPMTGSLAPPPPYGSEQGSILLESGTKDGYTPARGHSYSVSTYSRPHPGALDSGHTRSRSGNFRVMPPTSPGPVRSPTDISLAQLVPTEEAGESSSAAATTGHDNENGPSPVGLGLHGPHDVNHPPPPEYTSPEPSEHGSRRSSTDSEDTPLINITRSRGSSSAAILARAAYRNSQGPPSPPIPSYQDAVLQGANRDRSASAPSNRPTR
ncbi:SPRY-domain-containing protein [Thozetella sp. PMI_491]|nr:SPRY-domain-containing protein [Thozetella sp. PMI_491]